ncbi:hypothetical protein PR048_005093 [Dryococelus australis]|uniref:Uncharacterized protein n=1 Tax=Dryococelus australis TaxID=614101 RepID=A0ABQ9I792_9NEOP|nr:hypothetical protein PR048_005093 [Dryococelus australis]
MNAANRVQLLHEARCPDFSYKFPTPVAIEEFKRHQNTEYHKKCLLQNPSYKKQGSVDVQVNVGLKIQIEDYFHNRDNVTGIEVRGQSDYGPFNLEEDPAHITSVHPLAIYLCCSSHSLNLALTIAYYVQAIRNCMGIVSNFCTFFKYLKRRNVLKDSIERKVPKANATCLKSLCPTRWIEHQDAILTFLKLIDVLPGLKLFLHGQTVLPLQMHISYCVLQNSRDPFRVLQTKNTDLILAMESAVLVEEAMKDLRENGHTEFQIEFVEVEEKAKDIEVDIVAPRRVER